MRITRGLPTEAVQRAALVAAGVTEAEMAEAYIDRGKPRKGEPAQPQRDYIIGASRPGYEVWVARAGVVSTTLDDALVFLARICDLGAVLCVAASGERFCCPSGAAPQIADGLRFAAAIRLDERAAGMAIARAGLRTKPAGKPRTPAAKLEAARAHWFNPDIDGNKAAEKAKISRSVLHRQFGPRNTPRFGRKET